MKLKTINLSGKQYAQVAERLRAIHEDHKDFDILTDFTVTEGGAVAFTATITIRDKVAMTDNLVTTTYTGHSYGKMTGAKAFEKLETIAVGRALAFAGYHADGEIASADEMQDMGKEGVDQDVLADAVMQITGVKSVVELESAYKALPVELRKTSEVINAGKRRKKELTTIE
jgi:hypothetical protein